MLSYAATLTPGTVRCGWNADERHVLLQAVRVLNVFNQSLLDVHQVVTEEFKIADAVGESLGEDVSPGVSARHFQLRVDHRVVRVLGQATTS